MSVTPAARQGTPGLSLQAAWAMCFVPQGTQPWLAAHSQMQPRSLLGWTTCMMYDRATSAQLSGHACGLWRGKWQQGWSQLGLVWGDRVNPERWLCKPEFTQQQAGGEFCSLVSVPVTQAGEFYPRGNHGEIKHQQDRERGSPKPSHIPSARQQTTGNWMVSD